MLVNCEIMQVGSFCLKIIRFQLHFKHLTMNTVDQWTVLVGCTADYCGSFRHEKVGHSFMVI